MAAAFPTPSKTMTVLETFDVFTAPLAADEWIDLLDEQGRLTTIVGLSHEDFRQAASSQHGCDPLDHLLAAAQAAHVSPHNVRWRIVSATPDEVFVEVSNDLRTRAADPDETADRNTSVDAQSRIDESRMATLRAW